MIDDLTECQVQLHQQRHRREIEVTSLACRAFCDDAVGQLYDDDEIDMTLIHTLLDAEQEATWWLEYHEDDLDGLDLSAYETFDCSQIADQPTDEPPLGGDVGDDR